MMKNTYFFVTHKSVTHTEARSAAKAMSWYRKNHLITAVAKKEFYGLTAPDGTEIRVHKGWDMSGDTTMAHHIPTDEDFYFVEAAFEDVEVPSYEELNDIVLCMDNI